MKNLMILSLTLFIVCTSKAQVSTRFEISSHQALTGKSMLVHEDEVYLTFVADSQNISSTFIAKWNSKTEKTEWCKKFSVDRGVTILPVKIISRNDKTFVLGAYDYSWKDGFMNGNYTFIHFDAEGNIINSTRLGSPTGGILRDIIADDENQVLFLGDRINNQSAYRTVLGRLNKNLEVITMKSLFKDFYTYGMTLQKDSEGNIYAAGHSRGEFGDKRSFVSKWKSNLEYDKSIIQLDESPNTAFNYIYIDSDNNLHLGGNLGNLATYVHLDQNMNLKYAHEFNSGYVRNIWKDHNNHTVTFIDGPNYFVLLDQNNQVRYEARYISLGTPTDQYYNKTQNKLYTFSYYNSSTDPVNKLNLNTHTYKLDKECFLNTHPGDFNGPLRKDSFGLTEMTIRNETMTQMVPDDILISDYTLTAKELCRIDEVSATESHNPKDFNLYPNPATDFITVKVPGTMDIYNVDILNQMGLKVFSQTGLCKETFIDISAWTAGLYILRMKDNAGKCIKAKFTVIK